MDQITHSSNEFFNWLDIATDQLFYTEFLVRLLVNSLASYLVIMHVYKPSQKDQEYTFTFLIFSPLVFFIVNLFSQSGLGMGFAFGLFAVFSILRYRTQTIPIKEMTYMFSVISIAVINALIHPEVSLLVLLFVNSVIIGVMYFTEKKFYASGCVTEEILYDRADLTVASKKVQLMEDLTAKMGAEIIDVKILERDFVRDVIRMKVTYKEEK